MIQAIHKGIEIELQIHPLGRGLWKCDYTLVRHPGRIQTLHPGNKEFDSEDAAKEYALQEARDEIDRETRGQPEVDDGKPPRQVRI
jgi:hypothetical protein